MGLVRPLYLFSRDISIARFSRALLASMRFSKINRLSPYISRGKPLETKVIGGDERDRTADPLLARQVLSQLSYTPTLKHCMPVGPYGQRLPFEQ